VPVSCVFPAGSDFCLLETRLQAMRLSPYRADLPARRPARIGNGRRFPGMLFSPFTFRITGKPSDPKTPPPVHARSAGYIAVRLVAHADNPVLGALSGASGVLYVPIRQVPSRSERHCGDLSSAILLSGKYAGRARQPAMWPAASRTTSWPPAARWSARPPSWTCPRPVPVRLTEPRRAHERRRHSPLSGRSIAI
jgi:hypothetical protein